VFAPDRVIDQADAPDLMAVHCASALILRTHRLSANCSKISPVPSTVPELERSGPSVSHQRSSCMIPVGMTVDVEFKMTATNELSLCYPIALQYLPVLLSDSHEMFQPRYLVSKTCCKPPWWKYISRCHGNRR
jgi:hypothetical protein